MVIAAAVLATSGLGQAAAASDGPVLYLSTHGAPTDCDVEVEGTHANGNLYEDSLHRQSCDGTLLIPALRTNTRLTVKVHANQPQDHSLTRELTVLQARDHQDLIDNNTAICFLVKALGDVVYTGMSAKGGDCNGD